VFVGAVAVAAGLHQLTALKGMSLRHCRSPMSFFLPQVPQGKHLDRAARAFVAGARHGIFCLGSCWMLMVLLIALRHNAIGMDAGARGSDLARESHSLRRSAYVCDGGDELVLLGAVLLVHPAFMIHLV
jgi:Predicted metal-binding integral membrane protein (DUF2182)